MNTPELSRVFEIVKAESIQSVDLKFTNLFGGLHHVTIPVANLNSELFENGIGIDGSSVPGFKVNGGSDLIIKPDCGTAVVDPFWHEKTLSMICNLYTTESQEPFTLDPRHVAEKAETYLTETDIADRSIWGPEFEFYIFDKVHFVNHVNTACYRIESCEADWSGCSTCNDDNSCTIPYKAGYHAAPPQDNYFNLRSQMCSLIRDIGIQVKYHHHEVGGPGQSEIEVAGSTLKASGDAGTIIKYICKMIARSKGYSVTFMPKPLYNEAGSGMHFHQQLFKGTDPMFFAPDGYSGLSETALFYIGGLLAHGPALLALTNPSTNSYKRLVPGFEAPVKAIFGVGNRAAAVRIPKYATKPETKRIEFRPPDATCNIYLAMAAQLMAGIDGIKNHIDPTELGFGPYDDDVTRLSKNDMNNIPGLPSSLPEALAALERDNEFLLEGNVFSGELIENWINWKYDKEISEVERRPHPYEMRLYLDA